MNPFEMVVLIVLVVVVGRIIQARYRYQGSQGRDDQNAVLENRQLRQDIETLKQRVQVLERVITDNHSSSDLDREIERLRDQI